MSARCLFAAVWLTMSFIDSNWLLAQDPPQAEVTSQAEVEPSTILGEIEPATQLAVEEGAIDPDPLQCRLVPLVSSARR